jgi:hypothetical protein
MKCRHCHHEVEQTLIDLGFSPPSNSYLSKDQLAEPELYYPLRVKVCSNCWLVQTEDYARAEELFKEDYAYFSSTSASWVAHAKEYVEKIASNYSLNTDSFVVEIASNDGYLLQYFVAKDVPCLGIEPTLSTARAATNKGIPTLTEFFGTPLAAKLPQADLIIANNVYAHVPDINDFTLGMKMCLKPSGIITIECPHVLQLLKDGQFDTIYHEHYSYLSLYTVRHIFESVGLRVFDVERLPTHGGSLRVFGCHREAPYEQHNSVLEILQQEEEQGLRSIAGYDQFQQKAEKIKDAFLMFLLENKDKKIAAYGAAAKGNTLLNYAGVKPDLLPFICDAAAAKQGKYLPGSHIPIRSPEELKREKPDYILVMPWNLKKELAEQLSWVKDWGGKLVSFIPQAEIWN